MRKRVDVCLRFGSRFGIANSITSNQRLGGGEPPRSRTENPQIKSYASDVQRHPACCFASGLLASWGPLASVQSALVRELGFQLGFHAANARSASASSLKSSRQPDAEPAAAIPYDAPIG